MIRRPPELYGAHVLLLRHVSGDHNVALRLGESTGYLPTSHVVQLGNDVQTWDLLEQLAVVGHEACHVRFTHYHEQSPTHAKDFRFLFNWMEDGRVHLWLRSWFPGLRPGVDALEGRAVDGLESGPLDRAHQFLVVLRARLMGTRHTPPADPAVRKAVRKCLPAAREALHALPGRSDYRDDVTRACSQVFVDLIVDPILPTYLELLDGGKPMPVIVLEDWPRPGPNEGGGANGGVSVDGSWDRAYNEVSNLLKDLVRSLKGALPPNDASEWVSGYRSGPRLDTRLLMPARIDPSRMLRAFERQTWNDSRQYRVGIGVDLSGSMEGAPLRQVGRGAVLVLEACEKLKVRTSVVGFGSTPHDEAVVLKHPWERLRDARPRLRAAMFDQLRLGDETPLLAALDLLGGLHVPEPGVFDLLLVLTDGHPSRRFSPRRAPQKRDGPWEAGYTEQCEATVQRLQSDNCLVLGVDVGERACIGKVFERHITVADVSGLPEALRGVLGAFLQG